MAIKYGFFLMPFLVSFLIAAILLIFFIFLNRKRKNNDSRISARHTHSRGISRLGGIAFALSFLIALISDKRLVIELPLLGVIISSGAILIFGFIDDMRELSWKIQLPFQIAIATFVYSVGIRLEYISNPFGGIILFNSLTGRIVGLLIVVAWVVFIMNAINWIDGIDGTSSGVAIIGALTIFFLSLRPEVNQPPVGIITAALIGGLAAFLLFNFHPAKIIAGTSGSMFMGFILAILAIFAGAKIATTLLVLIIPIVDALWVIFERYRSKKSIFQADRSHLHYRLLNLGWSQEKICIFYYCATILVAFLALNTRAMGKATTLVLFVIVIIIMLALIKNKISRQV